MTQHCSDNAGDRAIGEYWERQFCAMAARRGLMFTGLQWHKTASAVAGKRTPHGWHVMTLPDVVIWTAPGQHHEIKHKNPTNAGEFGLEVYRFDALLDFARETQQDVMYTIHNHDKAGGRDIRDNNIMHWQTANVWLLNNAQSGKRRGPSWVNGEKRDVEIYYWHSELWQPLALYWENLNPNTG